MAKAFRPFNVTELSLTLPEDISVHVAVDWLNEVYGPQLYAVALAPAPSTPWFTNPNVACLSIRANAHCRLNDILDELQASADLLRRRTRSFS